MTQKELAERLHVTNSAVSKWERGLCLPDVALLPKLADELQLTVAELVGAEPPAESADEIEKSVRAALHYSAFESARRARSSRKRILLTAVICILLAVGGCLGFLWRKGTFDLLERLPSPDGSVVLAVYGRDVRGVAAVSPAVTLQEYGARQSWSVYGGCVYEGAWWSPDGARYVVALQSAERGGFMTLNTLSSSSSANLSALLSLAVMESPIAEYGLPEGDGVFPTLDFHFMQWSRDSESILVFYSFEGGDGAEHSGYFWYSLPDGNLYGILELA